jgi:hypothetical protein
VKLSIRVGLALGTRDKATVKHEALQPSNHKGTTGWTKFADPTEYWTLEIKDL